METEKVLLDDIPNKHIQMYLHPLLFDNYKRSGEQRLSDFPNYFDIISPELGVFNTKMMFRMVQLKLLEMCQGLNEDRLQHELLTCGIVVFLYSNNKILGIMGLNENEDDLHIEVICTNNNKYKGVGTYMIDIANEIAKKLGKRVLSLNALEQAVPFYLKMGFQDTARNTIPMDKLVVEKPLRTLSSASSLRRSRRRRGEEPTATVEEPTATVEEPSVTVEEPTATVEEPSVTVEEPTVEEPTATVEEPSEEPTATSGGKQTRHKKRGHKRQTKRRKDKKR